MNLTWIVLILIKLIFQHRPYVLSGTDFSNKLTLYAELFDPSAFAFETSLRSISTQQIGLPNLAWKGF